MSHLSHATSLLPYKETPEPIRAHCRLQRMSRGSACRLLEVWAVASQETLLPLRHFVSAVYHVCATPNINRRPSNFALRPPLPHTYYSVRSQAAGLIRRLPQLACSVRVSDYHGDLLSNHPHPCRRSPVQSY